MLARRGGAKSFALREKCLLFLVNVDQELLTLSDLNLC
jgi:hypothetical protein